MCLAVPGRVERIEGRKGVVDFEGAKRKVDISLIENCTVGDFVIVHAGFAIEKMDEEDANQTLELLRQLQAVRD